MTDAKQLENHSEVIQKQVQTLQTSSAEVGELQSKGKAPGGEGLSRRRPCGVQPCARLYCLTLSDLVTGPR